MAPAQRHRQPIIDAAVTLFRRAGYSATGLNDIVDASGAPKGSLYHYFPEGKRSIAVVAIDEAGRRAVATLEQLSADVASARELILAYARLLARWMAKSGFRDGCPITTVLLELAPSDRAVTEAGRRAYASRISAVQAKLVSDGLAPQAARRLATLAISSLQGALIQARIERSAAPLLTAAEELARLLPKRA